MDNLLAYSSQPNLAYLPNLLTIPSNSPKI